jgi:DHA1 family tetracycline resistance protein-like MFS transporter
VAALDNPSRARFSSPFLSRRLAFFLLAMALTEATRAMTSVQIPLYLRALGADVTQVGLFFTLSAIIPLVLLILGGWLSDSLGRLRAIAIGSVAGVIAYVIFAMASSWQGAILAPAFLAVAFALIRPSYRAFLADQTLPENRGRIFGSAETITNLTWIFGPPLGGFLAQNYGFERLFFVTGLAYAVAGEVILLMARTNPPAAEPPAAIPSLRSLRTSLLEMGALLLSGGVITWLLITDGVRDVAFRTSFELMPVYLKDIWGLTVQDIGFLDGIFGVVLVATSYPAGWLCDKISERFALVCGLAAVLASRLAFILVSRFWGFAFSWSLLAIGVALMDPAIQSLISKGAPQRLRGICYGLLTTSWGLISLPSPWIGGLLWARFGPRAPFLATVILGALTLIPAWTKLAVPKAGPETTKDARPTA